MEALTPQIIPRIEDPDTFSYNEFFHKYLMANAPCLFSAEFTASWSSRRTWVTSENKPNWGHLLRVYGDAIVPVANCDVKEYNANPKELLPLREYITYWTEYTDSGGRSARGCLYLKDWHMTRTPFHADVFRSYSWSANICGRKKWLLYPPGQEERLRDNSGHLPYDATAPALRHRCPPPMEVVQEAGEIIFVPSGWHHQVYNLDDTISINHNWVNGCNVSVMWSFLRSELSAVQREISEWRESMEEWDQHCQIILRSCTGIDYKEFYSFLRIIAERRIQDLQDGHKDRPLLGPTMMAPGPQHLLFDLRKVTETLTSLMDNEEFQKLETETLEPQPEDLMRELRRALGDGIARTV